TSGYGDLHARGPAHRHLPGWVASAEARERLARLGAPRRTADVPAQADRGLRDPDVAAQRLAGCGRQDAERGVPALVAAVGRALGRPRPDLALGELARLAPRGVHLDAGGRYLDAGRQLAAAALGRTTPAPRGSAREPVVV